MARLVRAARDSIDLARGLAVAAWSILTKKHADGGAR